MSCDNRGERKGHLSQETLRRLKMGILTPLEKIDALSHIGRCAVCAYSFSESYEQTELLELPPQFASGVEKKLSELRVTAAPFLLGKRAGEELENSLGKRDLKKEYRRYSCRVAIAACVALLLLFSGTFNEGMNAITKSKVLNPDLSRVNQLTQSLSDFSKELVHREVKNND